MVQDGAEPTLIITGLKHWYFGANVGFSDDVLDTEDGSDRAQHGAVVILGRFTQTRADSRKLAQIRSNFDIKKRIWACRDLRWGGAIVAVTAEMNRLVE